MYIDDDELILTKQFLLSDKAVKSSVTFLKKSSIILTQQNQQKNNAFYLIKKLKDKFSFVLIILIQSNIQFLDIINLNKDILILKTFFSKLSLKNQAITSLSGLLVNLIEITDKMKIMKNFFKQAINRNDITSIVHFFILKFKYKFSVCNQFFKVSVLFNDYSKSAKETVKKKKINEKNTENEIKNKENKHQCVKK